MSRIALDDFPTLPGVYLMLDAEGEVLYVGKAKNLKARIRSYFRGAHDERVQVPLLVAQIASIDTIVVTSEKEALLLENTLIKRHQPKYNVLLKDDKGYISLKLTTKHPWPKLELVRLKGAPPRDGSYFGPYTSAQAARGMFDLIGTLFPLRQCSDEEFARRKRPCILYQIKRCCAPCVRYVTEEVYQGYVDAVSKLLRGQNEAVVKQFDREMQEASEKLEFEKAAGLLKKKRLIEQVAEKQRVDRAVVADTDVWALFREGHDVVVTKLLWRGSKLIGSHHFDFDRAFTPTEELLESFVVQHYLDNPLFIPSEILLAHKIQEPEVVSALLAEKAEKKVELLIPIKGEKKRLCDMAFLNAQSAYQMRKNVKTMRENALLELQDALKLSRYPRRIDCFDNSHFAGTELVSSCVTYVDGQKYTPAWRKYRIRTVSGGDDYAMMQEAIYRRYKRAEEEEEEFPDLIIIDGGKGHLEAALKVMKELEIVSCDLIAIAKETGRHDKGQTQERIFTPTSARPISLDPHSSVLFLLQRIRDEAHRFVLAYQQVRRKKATIKSALDDIVGIGPVKKKKLIHAFGSVKAIREATLEELQQVPGLSKKDAQTIHDFFIT